LVYRAVHADRSGRILVADHPALVFDGIKHVPLTEAIPLPGDTPVVGVEREALASERSGRPRRLGAGRLAAAALLAPGHLRTHLPAYVDEPGKADLAPRQYAAVAADEAGALVVAAVAIEPDQMPRRAKSDVADKVAAGLRAHPGDRMVRQLARCAREYACRPAAGCFFTDAECALPIAAPSNERPPASIAPMRDGDAEPTEAAAFHPSADEIADRAVAHFEAGGRIASFGQACEGEPLLAARELEEAVAQIRLRTRGGTIHLNTNGSTPAGLRRLRSAGLDSIGVRMISARAGTYESLHGPDGYRFPDVRATLRLATELRLAITLRVLVLPGVFDRADELVDLIALLAELPEGSTLLVRDLHADPLRALARLHSRGIEPIGIRAAIERIKRDAPQVQVTAFLRPVASAEPPLAAAKATRAKARRVP
jgi:pyruvate-formate lyase-activating enzyme